MVVTDTTQKAQHTAVPAAERAEKQIMQARERKKALQIKLRRRGSFFLTLGMAQTHTNSGIYTTDWFFSTHPPLH